VTVLIPCFNLGRYLDEAVDSVLAQTFTDFEILIVDDGSTDPETKHLLADYRRPRTQVIRTERRGLAAARNLAIERARGRYLSALDADDRLHPRFLEKTFGALEADADLTFASTWLRVFGDEDWLWRPQSCDLPTLLAECTVMTAAVVRKAAVVAVGGYDGGMPAPGFEDWDLWLSLVEAGSSGIILPEVLFDYRRRAGSMSSICDHGQPHLELTRYIVDKHGDSYRRYLLPVLMRREGEIATLLRTNDRLERRVSGDLAALLGRRSEELERLRTRLGQTPRATEPAVVVPTVAAARHEIEALRASRSWRLTRPLRTVYGWLLRLSGTSS